MLKNILNEVKFKCNIGECDQLNKNAEAVKHTSTFEYIEIGCT